MSSCVKCGSPAELLLNLVCCTKARCQNFDHKFYKKWLSKCGRTFSPPNTGWKFLGQYVSNKLVANKGKRLFDLYHNGPEVYAIYMGDFNEETLAGDTNGDPLGFHLNWFYGPEMVDEAGRDALLEAAARKNL